MHTLYVSIMTIIMQWEQISEKSHNEKAIALTEKEDLALNLKLKRGMAFEIEDLQSSLKAKEAGMCLIAGPIKFTVWIPRIFVVGLGHKIYYL